MVLIHKITRRSIWLLFSLLALSIHIVGASRSNGTPISKFSPDLATALSDSSEFSEHICWVFLESSAWLTIPIRLGKRAMDRRAKVDPDNFLLDSLDYEIDSTVLSAIDRTGCRIRTVSHWLRGVSVKADQEQLEAIAELPEVVRLSQVKHLTFVRPESKLRDAIGEAGSDDPFYGTSFTQNELTKATKLHRAGLTGRGVRIAILDSGFDLAQPAFDSATVVATWDFINGVEPVDQFDCPTQSNSNRQNYHGTLVVGTIAAFVPGELIGSAYHSELMLAKTEITCDGTEIKIEEDNWIAAAQWAEAGGADIITSSLGYYLFSDGGSYQFSDLDGETALITIAADIAASKNVLVITSAGNERGTAWDHIMAPADGDLVIAVGAVSADSSLAPFSSPGPTADGRIKPDCVSLGVQVKSTFDLGGYLSVSGTSFSAPLVAAVCGLAMEHDPTLTALEMRQNIQQTSNRNTNPDNNFGFGLFDGARAADIMKVDSLPPIRLLIGQEISVPLSSSGRSDSIAELSAFGLPNGSELIDSGNGRGYLKLIGSPDAGNLRRIGLVADVGYFTDTTFLEVETYAPGTVTFGPNPFTDIVRFIVSAKSGEPVTITVFSSSGEKIIELVDQSHTLADDSIRVITWDGHNSRGRKAASGVYLAYVKTIGYDAHVKLLKTD